MPRTKRPAEPSFRRRSMAPRRLVALIGYIAAITVLVADFPAASARPKAATKLLDYGEGQRFVLGLVNRDRKKAGLEPVALDEAASKAGLRHARDMAAKGFTGHLGSDGSTPEQRYTDGGGTDFVQENAACLSDTIERELDAKPRFDQAKLAALHQMFMDEVPPNDGHRRNILNPLH